MSERMFLSAPEVAQILGISRGKSYELIRKMNKELSERGFITIAGKIPTEYFKEKWYGAFKEEVAM